MQLKNMTIKQKILIPMIALTLVAAAAILLSNIIQFTGYVDEVFTSQVDTASNVAESEFETLKNQAATVSAYMAVDRSIISAMTTKSQDKLLARAQTLMEKTGVTMAIFTNSKGIVLLRTLEPELSGDDLSGLKSVQSALSGTPLTSIEEGAEGSSSRMTLTCATPVYDTSGMFAGVVIAGFRLDTMEFVDKMKLLTGCETTVFLHDQSVATTVTQSDGNRAVGTTADAEVSETVLQGNPFIGKSTILNRSAATKYIPIQGVDGSAVGMLCVGQYLDAKTTTVLSFMGLGLLILALLLAAAVPLILYLVKRIVAPIGAMVSAANQIAKGDTQIDLDIDTNDEMRSLADAFKNMIENVKDQAEVIKTIAEGDLTVSVKARSENDVMSQALTSMVALNNDAFARIADTANQVSVGSRQIADSAQYLSQGAVEQTTAVEKLSAIVREMDEKTQENADMAQKALALADTIKDNAHKGAGQMQLMTKAVHEINEANQSIGKIIKVINEIAFQTNLLALNASVEAARAGAHGKGFAVVADEVRNLAAKSAEAAKETGTLLTDSAQKVELGVRIAGETAGSLNQIMAGINENGSLVTQIVNASQRQRDAILKINASLSQVTQVVQRNSATAEESAAASEEMSAQSEALHRLTTQFKLASCDQEGVPLAQ